ncbi:MULTISPECIES: hypothetical protein [Clostridium]|jgi:hypothetical protein|uniref:hypothetical protein n=1 Tax=Clostridium TaxID=1485 RepID=UPI00028858E9|nr:MULTISPECIES: hypothetical protein [Clostridium]MDF2505683.1 hypothetical protein [Clostridium sp.]
MKVQGFFSGIKNANEAVEKLKSEGFQNTTVDLNEHYLSTMHRSPRVAGAKNGASLSSLVLDTENYRSDDAGSAAKAASPMVSGMGSFEEIANINYKVVVETENKNVEKAKSIIKDIGGDFRNYNLSIPDRINP